MDDPSPNPFPRRQKPAAMPVVDVFNRSEIVFVTVCSEKRKPILARDDSAAAIVEAWGKADHFRVGRYVLLPDHIHLFCAPASREVSNVKRWLKYWKAVASRHWPRPGEHPVWQVDGWDRQLRSGESYDQKWEYVRNNPVRHGLVQNAEEWPFQGEIHRLEWHD